MIEIATVSGRLYGNLCYLSDKLGMYIIIIPKHVVAVEVTEDNHIYLIDNHSKSPLPAEGSARLSQRCDAVYKITKKAEPVFLKTEIKIEVSKYSKHLNINAIDIYENSEDNINRSLGFIYHKDLEELKAVITRLQRELL